MAGEMRDVDFVEALIRGQAPSIQAYRLMTLAFQALCRMDPAVKAAVVEWAKERWHLEFRQMT